MNTLVLFVRLIVGAIFLMSAISKLAVPRQFAKDVQRYRLLPHPLASTFGYALPYVELVAALSLLTGVYANWAALAVVVMLVSFMIAVGVAMFRKFNLSCNCFGLLYRERVGWSTQIRDGVLLAMALFVLVGDAGELTLADMLAEPGRLSYALGLTFTAIALGLGLVVAVLSVRLARRRRTTDNLVS